MPVNGINLNLSRPMFVNTIQSSPKRQLIESTQNCASCSAAGAICLLQGSLRAATSLDASNFAQGLHSENTVMPAYRMGGTPEEQLRNIVSYVTSRSSCNSVEAPPDLSLEAATNWMLSQPKGTIFTVYVAGTVGGKEAYHFLNAAHMDNIIYIDFQTNRGPRVTGRGHEYEPYPGHLGPATSDTPFVGIITQQYATSTSDMHAQVQEGSFAKETARLTIFAFQQT